MNSPATRPQDVRQYFVDEAGDGSLFDRRGRVIIGQPGCSRYFVLGLVDIAEPDALARELSALRGQLRADPYFKGVPSMQMERRRTALAFHAKDDPPEVRREVFGVLTRHVDGLRFLAVVRDKTRVLESVRQRNASDQAYRYHPNELYDSMVRRLFKNQLHKSRGYRIFFARRGKRDRTEALRSALETARQRFAQQHGITSETVIEVVTAGPPRCPGLQVADYLLWALQRLYERGEERYVDLLRPAFRLVHDIDDTRPARYGVYYTKRKPLTAAALNAARDIGPPSP
jgi:hypothetical protein